MCPLIDLGFNRRFLRPHCQRSSLMLEARQELKVRPPDLLISGTPSILKSHISIIIKLFKGKVNQGAMKDKHENYFGLNKKEKQHWKETLDLTYQKDKKEVQGKNIYQAKKTAMQRSWGRKGLRRLQKLFDCQWKVCVWRGEDSGNIWLVSRWGYNWIL